MSVPKDMHEQYVQQLKKKRRAYEKKFFKLSRKKDSTAEKMFVLLLYPIVIARKAIPILYIIPMLLAHLLYQSDKLSYFLDIAQPITFYTYESLALILVAVTFYAFIVESTYTKLEVDVGPSLSFANLDMRKDKIVTEYRVVISELEKHHALEQPPNQFLMKYKG